MSGLWSDERLLSEMKAAAYFRENDYGATYVSVAVHGCAGVARAMRDDYEARIAELEAAQAWRTIEDDEVWLRLPDEAGGIL